MGHFNPYELLTSVNGNPKSHKGADKEKLFLCLLIIFHCASVEPHTSAMHLHGNTTMETLLIFPLGSNTGPTGGGLFREPEMFEEHPRHKRRYPFLTPACVCKKGNFLHECSVCVFAGLFVSPGVILECGGAAF